MLLFKGTLRAGESRFSMKNLDSPALKNPPASRRRRRAGLKLI